MRVGYRLFISLTACVLGGVIVFLAVPRTVGAFSLLLVEPIRQQMRERQEVPVERLLALQEAQAAVYAALPSGGLAFYKSITESAIARIFPGENPERELWNDRAQSSVEQSVLVAPGESYAWYRLAFLRMQGGEDFYPAAKAALVYSVLTGPREQPLLFERIETAIRMWDRLSEDEVALMEDQILWADQVSQSRLIRIAKRNRKSLMVIFAAMAKDLNRFQPFVERFNR